MLLVLVGNVQKISICGPQHPVAFLEVSIQVPFKKSCSFIFSGVCCDTALLRDGALELRPGADNVRCDTSTEDGIVLTHLKVFGHVHCIVLPGVTFSAVMLTVMAMDAAKVTLHDCLCTQTLHAFVINAGSLTFLGTASCVRGALHINRTGHILGVRCCGSAVPALGTTTIRLDGPSVTELSQQSDACNVTSQDPDTQHANLE